MTQSDEPFECSRGNTFKIFPLLRFRNSQSTLQYNISVSGISHQNIFDWRGDKTLQHYTVIIAVTDGTPQLHTPKDNSNPLHSSLWILNGVVFLHKYFAIERWKRQTTESLCFMALDLHSCFPLVLLKLTFQLVNAKLKKQPKDMQSSKIYWMWKL